MESKDFLTQQLITYIGNKRKLLRPISDTIKSIQKNIGKDKLIAGDFFAGSGIVSRLLKSYSSLVVSNDIEQYTSVINSCFLTNAVDVDFRLLKEICTEYNLKCEKNLMTGGIIRKLYAPCDENNIISGDRVFYTIDNACRLDTYIPLLDSLECKIRTMLLGPLLSQASVHTNTCGVFKGFYKDTLTKIGKYGGQGEHALSRIKGKILLDLPILSNFETESIVHKFDAQICAELPQEYDVVYLDPPYNQHPYGSNYFMLNLLVDYREPTNLSKVSGIPTNWQRSCYYKKNESKKVLDKLVETIKSKYILISFNNEGFISESEMNNILKKYGTLEIITNTYNTFRGSRNLINRNNKVQENLFVLKKF